MTAPMIPGPGDYKLRNGAKFVCKEVFDGFAYGREYSDGTWDAHRVDAVTGKLVNNDASKTRLDVIGPWQEPRKPLELWVNEYGEHIGADYFFSRNDADECQDGKRTAVIRLVEVERIET